MSGVPPRVLFPPHPADDPSADLSPRGQGKKQRDAARAGNGYAALNDAAKADGEFYPTPPEATEALIRAERGRIDALRHDGGALGAAGDPVWDPACGEGAILKVFRKNGLPIVGTDLYDRGFSRGGDDFLRTARRSRIVVTNPPFSLAEDFIRRCTEIEAVYAAFLLKSTYFHAAARALLFIGHAPARIYPLSWRLDFLNVGRPEIECAWFVFAPRARARGWDEPTIYGPPLPRPADSTSRAFDFSPPRAEGRSMK